MMVNDVNAKAILPALRALHPAIAYTPAAHALVVGTGLVESQYGAIVQGGGGPALSFWQIEPNTYNDVVKNFLPYRPAISAHLQAAIGRTEVGLADRVATDLILGAAMCRIIYYRSKLALPRLDAGDLARYHKTVYNTALGAADPVKNIPAFQKAVDLVNQIS